VKLHESCTTDREAPRFDYEWQRRAFGLALALAEFGHYQWEDFQRALIQEIGIWDSAPGSERADWEYYDHWVAALEHVIDACGVLTVAPEQKTSYHR
jgi:nitrile hydratase accessory protein